MSQILFVGGGLDSVTGAALSENNGGFHDSTYAPSCLLVEPRRLLGCGLPRRDPCPCVRRRRANLLWALGFQLHEPLYRRRQSVAREGQRRQSLGCDPQQRRKPDVRALLQQRHRRRSGLDAARRQLHDGAKHRAHISGWISSSRSARPAITLLRFTTGRRWSRPATFTQASFTNVRSMRGAAPTGGSGEFWEIAMTEGFNDGRRSDRLFASQRRRHQRRLGWRLYRRRRGGEQRRHGQLGDGRRRQVDLQHNRRHRSCRLCDPRRVPMDEGQERRLLAGQHQVCCRRAALIMSPPPTCPALVRLRSAPCRRAMTRIRRRADHGRKPISTPPSSAFRAPPK
jgi:hypothetical protein